MRNLLIASLLFPILTSLSACASISGAPDTNSFKVTTWESPLLLEHPLVGKIYNVATAEELTSKQLMNVLLEARVVLIGEKHDNPDHHQLEEWLLDRLVDENTSVVFEMLDDRHLDALHYDQKQELKNMDLDELRKHLNWKDKDWDWGEYGPLFKQVIADGGNVVAGNIDRSLMMKIYKKGISSLGEEGRFSSIESIGQEQIDFMLEDIYQAHCEKMARDHLGPMVRIQLAKDASMASALRNSKAGRKILIAGGGHQLKNMGVPTHIVSEELKPIILQLLEVEKDVLSWSETDILSAEEADFVWFTPKFTDRDYCADIK